MIKNKLKKALIIRPHKKGLIYDNKTILIDRYGSGVYSLNYIVDGKTISLYNFYDIDEGINILEKIYKQLKKGNTHIIIEEIIKKLKIN